MDTPVDMPMDVEPMDAQPVEDETPAAEVEGRTDDAMPTFDVPDTAEELSDDFLAPPPEDAIDPDVAAIFDAVAGEEFAPVDSSHRLSEPDAAVEPVTSEHASTDAGAGEPESTDATDPTDATESTAATDPTDATESTDATDPTAATDPTDATDATDATEEVEPDTEPGPGADPDAPLVNLPDAHDPELVARIDDLLAGFQLKLDELIAELHAE